MLFEEKKKYLEDLKASGNRKAVNDFLEGLLEGPDAKKMADEEFQFFLNEFGEHIFGLGEFEKAIAVFSDCLVKRIELFGSQSLEVSEIYNNLGVCYKTIGKFQPAEEHYLKSLEIRRLFKEERPDLFAQSLNNIGLFFKITGAFEKSEEYLLQAFQLKQEFIDETHPEFSDSTNNLGLLYMEMGYYKKAEYYLKYTERLRMTLYGDESPYYAQVLNNLCGLYQNLQNYEEAGVCSGKSYEICHGTFGDNHPFTTIIHINDIYIQLLMKSFSDDLLPVIDEAIERARTIFGEGHHIYSRVLLNKALFYIEKREFDAAELYLDDMLQIESEKLGNEHLNIASIYKNYAYLFYLKGDYKKAFEKIRQCMDIETTILIKFCTWFPEEFIWNYKKTLDSSNDILFSILEALNDEACLDKNDEILQCAYNAIFVRKNITLEIISRQRKLVQQSQSKSDEKHYELLKQNRNQIMRLLMNPEEISGGAVFEAIQELEAEAEQIEKNLSRIISYDDMKEYLVNFDLNNLFDSLNSDEAFFDFYVYKSLKDSKLQYNLFFCTDEHISYLNTGDLNQLNILIGDHIKSIKAQDDCDVIFETGRDLFAQIVHPALMSAESSFKKLYFSPVSELSKLPFETVSSDGETFLVEEYLISYLNSGRDILKRMNKKRQNLSGSVSIFCDPAFTTCFDEQIVEKDNELPELIKLISEEAKSFERLVYSREEGHMITETFKKSGDFESVEMFMDSDFTKLRFLSVENPKCLHVATHGFYLGENRFVGDFKFLPFLNSGFVVSGFNDIVKGFKMAEEFGNSIITAYDVLNMNLEKTYLVVLSICNSALGTLTDNERMIGLRRAFTLSGAENIVNSLWNVPDDTSRTLFQKFYSFMLNDACDVSEALNKAQNELIEELFDEYGDAHPVDWAGFVHYGI